MNENESIQLSTATALQVRCPVTVVERAHHHVTRGPLAELVARAGVRAHRVENDRVAL
eukprot:COSAG03_NODE_8749_length_774_cov_1.248889_2_plen_57_part_01